MDLAEIVSSDRPLLKGKAWGFLPEKSACAPSCETVLRIRDVYPRSRIPVPDFYPSRIPDPRSWIPDLKTATKERGEKKLDVIPFYVATNFTKL